MNTGKTNLNIHKLKPNAEFAATTSNSTNVFAMMFHQTVSLCRDHPRSIILLSLIQFGVYFVCNGQLLFFPAILNQTGQFQGNSTTKLCEIVESAIKMQRIEGDLMKSNCIDELDISSYYYTMLLECCYVVGFLLISWMVNCTGRLAIFSFIFFSTGICGFAVNFSDVQLGTYFYVWLLASGINNTLLNTVTYDLFPTHLRSLAMSLSLMFGRLGSLVGGNVAGILLENYCSWTFTLSGGVMMICGVLTFFIPNIFRK